MIDTIRADLADRIDRQRAYLHAITAHRSGDEEEIATGRRDLELLKTLHRLPDVTLIDVAGIFAGPLPAADDPLVLLAAKAMWTPSFGHEGQTFAERDPRLTANWIEKARYAVAALRPYLIGGAS